MTLRFQPMWDSAKYPQNHGAMMAVQTELSSTGKAKARRTLFIKMAQSLEHGANLEALLRDAEELTPHRLVNASERRLEGIEELLSPPAALEQIEERMHLLRDLAGGKPGRITRTVHTTLDAVVLETVVRVKASILRAFDESPGELGGALREIRKNLDSLEPPPPSSQPLQRLKNAVQAIKNLRAIPDELPRKWRQKIDNLLLIVAQTLYAEARTEQIRQLIAPRFEEACVDLTAFLAETQRQSSDYRERLHEVQKLQDAAERDAENRAFCTRSDAILVLEGPDEQEVLAGMRERLKLVDTQALAAHLGMLLTARLRQWAKDNDLPCESENVGFNRLLLAVRPELLAQLWAKLTEDNLGEGQSLYQRLKRCGLKDIAVKLYHKSEHTVDLGERDCDELGVNTKKFCIVSLPQPGQNEREIRVQLETAFRQLDRRCDFQDSPAHSQVVSILRGDLGYPQIIDQSNAALLMDYAEAATERHLPHPICLSDDHSATAKPRFVELGNRFIDDTHEP